MPAVIQLTKGPLQGTAIALTEKAGCTSIQQSIKRQRAGRVLTVKDAASRKVPLRIYLRHPLKRFTSAYCWFRPSQFPRETGIGKGASFDKFIDEVLRGVHNEHWQPQMAMYRDCNIVEIYQFERIAETWPDKIPLLHLNTSYWKKPELGYRLDELREYYAEDLAQWENLNEPSNSNAVA